MRAPNEEQLRRGDQVLHLNGFRRPLHDDEVVSKMVDKALSEVKGWIPILPQEGHGHFDNFCHLGGNFRHKSLQAQPQLFAIDANALKACDFFGDKSRGSGIGCLDLYQSQ